MSSVDLSLSVRLAEFQRSCPEPDEESSPGKKALPRSPDRKSVGEGSAAQVSTVFDHLSRRVRARARARLSIRRDWSDSAHLHLRGK